MHELKKIKINNKEQQTSVAFTKKALPNNKKFSKKLRSCYHIQILAGYFNKFITKGFFFIYIINLTC